MTGQPDTDPRASRAGVANIANLLTGLRIVLVPVFLAALFVGDGHETRWRIIAFVVFAAAVITDRFDGEIARSFDMVTEFGKLADPIADKALIGAALMGFGGVVAMGCSIGQGISGFSTLALGSILPFVAIVGAAALTLRVQYWRLMRAT